MIGGWIGWSGKTWEILESLEHLESLDPLEPLDSLEPLDPLEFHQNLSILRAKAITKNKKYEENSYFFTDDGIIAIMSYGTANTAETRAFGRGY